MNEVAKKKVRIRPRIGPAQGAHSNPVPIPSKNELIRLGPEAEFRDSLPPMKPTRDLTEVQSFLRDVLKEEPEAAA